MIHGCLMDDEWMFNVGTTMPYISHLGMAKISPLYSDDWGMVSDCFTHSTEK